MKPACTLTLLLMLPAPAIGQVDETVHVTAIDIVADIRDRQGRVPPDLNAADFSVSEDGVEKPVIGLEYLRRSAPAASTAPADWQVVIYFDLQLSSVTAIRDAARSLGGQAAALAALGPVDVVAADPRPSVLLAGSRDPAAIQKALESAGRRRARNELAIQRRMYQVRADAALARAGWDLAEDIRPYLLQEIAAVGRFRDGLAAWLSRYPRRAQRALFVVSEGFEVNPAEYYLQLAAATEGTQRFRLTASQYELATSTDALSRTLAAASWTTISIDGPFGAGEQWIDDAARSSVNRVQRPRAKEVLFATKRSRDPLLVFAEATGGSVVGRTGIPSAIATLHDRVRITYQVTRPPDGRLRPIEVRSRRPELVIRTFRWATESTFEDVATTRAVTMIESGSVVETGMPATVTIWDGELTVRASLEAIAGIRRNGTFRVTLVVRKNNGEQFVEHRLVTIDPAARTFSYRAPIDAPAGPLDVAVVVEELSTGSWGGAFLRTKV